MPSPSHLLTIADLDADTAAELCVTAEGLDRDRSVVWEQARTRLPMQQAILDYVGSGPHSRGRRADSR